LGLWEDAGEDGGEDLAASPATHQLRPAFRIGMVSGGDKMKEPKESRKWELRLIRLRPDSASLSGPLFSPWRAFLVDPMWILMIFKHVYNGLNPCVMVCTILPTFVQKSSEAESGCFDESSKH